MSRRSYWLALLSFLIGTISGASAWAQLPFFPGAEGYGGTFFGTAPAAGWFSNATVYHVTNLNDSGTGSLRDAFDENTSNRIIVFDVAGTIQLTSGDLDIKNLSNYYIAGQTAPGPITVYGDTTKVTHSSDKYNTNLILRNLTFRRGTEGSNQDSLTFSGGPSSDPTSEPVGRHMIFDHVSVSWSEDENLSIANHNTNITVQYSIIADALGGGNDHAYGSLVRPRKDASVTIHHNLYANNKSRQPRLGIYNEQQLTADVRNNVVYNWRDRATYAGGSSDDWNNDDIDDIENVDVNYVGNYLIAGPATLSNASTAFVVDKNVNLEAYQSGNLIDPDDAPGGSPADGVLDGTDTGWGMFTPLGSIGSASTFTMRTTPFSLAPVTTQSATDAYNDIITHVGNSRWGYDVIDQRLIDNVKEFTSPSNGVGSDNPIPSELAFVENQSQSSHPGGWDTDGDGMQDAWETEHGGDLVWNADFDNDDYINLIEYVNERGEFPATAPIDFNGATNSRYAQITNWKTNNGGVTTGSNWQPSRFDLARIHNGTVEVDAVGQHAGTLQLGPDAGNNATLNVTSGWIKVADNLEVGSASGAGGVNISSAATVYAANVNVNAMGVLGGSGDIVGNVMNGGLTSPGASPGTLSIDGSFSQIAGGTLLMEIDSLISFDQLAITGALNADGTLDIDLNYSPSAGDSFALLDFASATGSWIVDLPELAGSLAWDDNSLLSSGVLSVVMSENADFNNSGAVDGQDFLIWQRNFNTAGIHSQGDADGNSFIDGVDLSIWKSQYGPGGLSAMAIPEPTGLVLMLAAVLSGGALRRRAPKGWLKNNFHY